MKKKSVIMIISLVIIISLSLFGVLFYPKYQEKKEMKALSHKIEIVTNYLTKNEYQIKDLTDIINETVTSGERKIIEDKIDNYLNSLLTINQDYNIIKENEITKDTILSNISNKDKRGSLLKTLKDNNEKLLNLKDSLNKTNDESNNINFENEDYLKKYQELTKNINTNSLEESINLSSDNTSNYINVLNYLNKNDNWKLEKEKVVFTKRVSFKEYQKLNLTSIDYELVKDTTGPVITASNITITKGTNINIKDKVKCNDAVDGKVDCKISGNYDVKKVGNYSIKITASDESKNTSSKTIKLIVKEKVVNKKPYYIEVIRNHNVVIVYGLDSNNEYTKIMKVFICSVGKSNSQTPTGTFKTSDKASWGWLVGNLYGQYYTRITGSILFHSVPYTKKAKNTLEWDEYNKLGSAASKGCVRMTVKDVKWIYDNCPRGTTVKIYDGSLPKGVSKPTAKKISSDSPNKGWDPTDPDKNNPWKK